MTLETRLITAALLVVAAGCSKPAPAPTETPSASASASASPSPSPSASASASASAAAPAPALGWDDEVRLTGTLVEKEVLSAKGGSIKTTFLVVDAPISVHDKPGEKLGTYDGERELWYAGNGKPLPADLIGKHVAFRGRLNPMQTGHHHSNVWLTGDVTPLAH